MSSVAARHKAPPLGLFCCWHLQAFQRDLAASTDSRHTSNAVTVRDENHSTPEPNKGDRDARYPMDGWMDGGG